MSRGEAHRAGGRRLALIGIGLGVVGLHALAFWAFSGLRPLPKRPHVPPPNFHAAEKRGADPETGEPVIYREFTVSTRLEERGPARAEGGE